ncbi:Short-chain dehydrogenase/reductase (SDR) family protein [Penicillium ucsense]|uniref:Short-chain dehydrogenase/reductase (SDR) family protein n=1 Tax=Penicillium ucsense TaxID=2839758 RepID=A0A8J8VX08_9EURO|nr:Short-chain dehydrogenase/reductase (SDR) family protein [Penicillium ucsense]KAF7737374.1 Short-chain dehydrogenase/reductase (SDR) family protein [Penicillium ucsense]
MSDTWVIVGASRGIGLEFVRQLLHNGFHVIAGVRDLSKAEKLDEVKSQQTGPERCIIEQCDITDEQSIQGFADKVKEATRVSGLKVTNIVLNAGILHYPNRATEISFADFALHLHTNTIGPIICAQKLLNLNPDSPPSKVVFISSDSGSTTIFRDDEDGFGAYGASKAALNQMLRHMAAELTRRGGQWTRTSILAMHPGEVETDMANIDLGWEVHGSISAEESVRCMLQVISEKDETGSFWCWDGRRHPW